MFISFIVTNLIDYTNLEQLIKDLEGKINR